MEGEDDRIAVQAILDSELASPTLAKRAKELDLDGDGTISIGEFLQAMRAEQNMVAEKRLLVRILIAVGVGLLLTIAAVVGLTYAVVELSKDTQVRDGKILEGKSSKEILGTATVVTTIPMMGLFEKNVTLTDFLALEAVGIGIEAESMRYYRVSSLEHYPGQNLTVHTFQPDTTITISPEGVDLGGNAFLTNLNDVSKRSVKHVMFEGIGAWPVRDCPYACMEPCKRLEMHCDPGTRRCEYRWVNRCDF